MYKLYILYPDRQQGHQHKQGYQQKQEISFFNNWNIGIADLLDVNDLLINLPDEHVVLPGTGYKLLRRVARIFLHSTANIVLS